MEAALSARAETQRLIDLALARLRQDPAAAFGLRQAAWGATEEPVSAARLAELGADLPEPVALDLSALPPDCVFAPARARVLLNLLLVAADSLRSGGVIRLAGDAGDLFVAIAGPSAAWPPGMALCVVNEAAAQAALAAESDGLMPLTALLALATGLRLSLLLSPRPQAQPPIVRLGG